jgi:hypothetical protein
MSLLAARAGLATQPRHGQPTPNVTATASGRKAAGTAALPGFRRRYRQPARAKRFESLSMTRALPDVRHRPGTRRDQSRCSGATRSHQLMDSPSVAIRSFNSTVTRTVRKPTTPNHNQLITRPPDSARRAVLKRGRYRAAAHGTSGQRRAFVGRTCPHLHAPNSRILSRPVVTGAMATRSGSRRPRPRLRPHRPRLVPPEQHRRRRALPSRRRRFRGWPMTWAAPG